MQPFTEARHEDLRAPARALALQPDVEVPAWLDRLRAAGLLRLPPEHDVRTLCVLREELAYGSPLADVALALQGLGTYPLARFAGRVPDGVAAFAVTEPEAGSDLFGIQTRASHSGGRWTITGTKTFISNAPVADFFSLFARTGEGRDGLSAFLVPAKQSGLRVMPQEVSDPHPIGELILDGASGEMVGREGQGFEIAGRSVEDHFADRMRVADLLRKDAHAGLARGDPERAQTVAPFAGAREEREEIRDRRVGDERLSPGDRPAFAVARGARLDAVQIGSRLRLGDGERGDAVGHPPREARQRIRAEPLQRQRHVGQRRAVRQLLAQHAQRPHVVLRRQAQQARVA